MSIGAATDRRLHLSVVVELNVPNFRMETAKTTRKSAVEAAASAGKFLVRLDREFESSLKRKPKGRRTR